jgi:hypothetical protein
LSAGSGELPEGIAGGQQTSANGKPWVSPAFPLWLQHLHPRNGLGQVQAQEEGDRVVVLENDFVRAVFSAATAA